jgi:diguanylate cyclase (GGDEF)-like protein/PAS domain S-box-containing protein
MSAQGKSNPAINILLVNDDEDKLNSIAVMLREQGLQIICKRSGDAALKYLSSHSVAVILLNVTMPMMDGFETAELIRKSENSRNVPIIFTAGTNPPVDQARKAYALGAVDFVAEDFLTQTLRARVTVFVKLHRQAMALRQQKETLEAAHFTQQRSEETIKALLDSQLDSAMLINPEGKVLALNQMAAIQLDKKENELVGHSMYSVLPNHLQESRKRRIMEALDSGQPAQFEEHSQSMIFEVHLFPIQSFFQEQSRIAIFIRDITVERLNKNKLRKANKQLKYMALHDSLTKLANRVMLAEHLARTVSSSKRKKLKFHVLFFDLDGFKSVNDALGHKIGDMLLLEMVNRVRSVIRTEDVMARVGGDEFVIVLDDCTDADSASAVCKKINQAIAEKYVLDNNDISISASLGISAYPEDGESASKLLENADSAMYLAKRSGKNTFKFFREYSG